MSNSSKLLILTGLLCFSVACNKVDPTVLSLGSEDGGGPAEAAPKNGRVTLGSDAAVLEDSSHTYRLKGRVSTIEPATPVPGAYKLSGTVRFN